MRPVRAQRSGSIGRTLAAATGYARSALSSVFLYCCGKVNKRRNQLLWPPVRTRSDRQVRPTTSMGQIAMARSRWLAEHSRCASLAHSLALSRTAAVRTKRALPDGLAKGTDPPLCYRSRSPQEGATTGPSREAFNPSARGCERYPPRAILRRSRPLVAAGSRAGEMLMSCTSWKFQL